MVKTFITRIQDQVFEDSERQVLTKLCALFAAWSLEKRLVDFYAGGYALKNSKLEFFIRDGIISICKDLVNEAVALIDVLAPPDIVVNSPLGMSDGEVTFIAILIFFKIYLRNASFLLIIDQLFVIFCLKNYLYIIYILLDIQTFGGNILQRSNNFQKTFLVEGSTFQFMMEYMYETKFIILTRILYR